MLGANCANAVRMLPELRGIGKETEAAFAFCTVNVRPAKTYTGCAVPVAAPFAAKQTGACQDMVGGSGVSMFTMGALAKLSESKKKLTCRQGAHYQANVFSTTAWLRMLAAIKKKTNA